MKRPNVTAGVSHVAARAPGNGSGELGNEGRLLSTSSAVISAAARHRHQTWGGGVYEKSDIH